MLRLVLLAVLLFAAPALAQDRPLWQVELEEQLRIDHECVLNYLTNVVEKQVAEQQVILARAHCKDGRAFDVNRSDEFADFDVRACGAQAC
jgi:hypothetical protein